MTASRRRLLLTLAILFAITPLHAGDWPMWRHDPGRTATTASVTLPPELDLIWSRALPAPEPAFRDTRLQFDAGYEPVVLGKLLFLGSNRDDSVTAFDTESGEERWKFHTDGPVRFAPVVGEERVIFGSDDGCLYCVNAADGSLVWKKRAVPSERRVLGNERLISVWPIRGGPVLHGDRVYFAAGVWPLEGTFVFCVDAATGETVWRNDDAAYLYQVHPHEADAFGGLAPQGYLLVDGGDLVVPSSQAYPARFDLETGALKEFELPAPGRIPGGWFASTPSEIEAQRLMRRGLLFDETVNAKLHEDTLHHEGLPEIRSTIRVGEREWRFEEELPEVEGTVHSLIAGDGKLFAAMSDGSLHAFGMRGADIPVRTHPRAETPGTVAQADLPKTDLPQSPAIPQHGYVVLLGVGDAARLAGLDADGTRRVIGIDGGADRVGSLRQEAWVGDRTHLIEADPAAVGLPPYFAHLIVVDESTELDAEQFARHFEALRPFGGTLAGRSEAFSALARSAALSRAAISEAEGWTLVTREGPLEGSTNYAADWAPSEDQLVKAPLGLLWFGDAVVHFKRSPQPKFIDGVMISNPKDWTDASTRQGRVDYRLLETEFTDVYTGRQLAAAEAPELRQSFSEVDRETIQPSQYRPPTQLDDWRPEAPRAGERVNPLTGETEPRTFPKSYGCDGGVDYGLLFSMRSGTPAFYDKRIESGTVNISGPRSGCTNSVVPANGILNLPFFYEGCTCAYPLPMSLALVSMPESFEQWASWGEVEPGSLEGKIQRLGLNFGAPGSRMTEDGTLWLDIPHVGGPAPEISVATSPPLETLKTFYRHSVFLEKGGTGWPWVAGSGVVGITRLTVGGLKPGDYRVRLTFCAPDAHSVADPGTVSVRLGESEEPSLLTRTDPRLAETRELETVKVGDDGQLTLSLSAAKGETYLNGLEIICADLPVFPVR